MAKYHVKLTAPRGHVVPPLLQSFGEWLAKQKYGDVGWFELQAAKVPKEWSPEAAERLQRDGFCFLSLPEGSELVLLKTGQDDPPAVVLLGSEGDSACVASSLEEFFHLLSQGETGIDDLDDEEAEGRAKLRSWLKKNKVTAPKAKSLDFDAYLAGMPPSPPPAATAAAPIPEVVADMPHDRFAELQALFGKTLDSKEVVAFLAKYPKHKITKPSDGQQHVLAPTHGFEMNFTPPDGGFAGGPAKQPRVLTTLFLNSTDVPKSKNFSDLPLGLSFDDGPEQVVEKLGDPLRTFKRDNGELVSMMWRVKGLMLTVGINKDRPTIKDLTLMFPTPTVLAALGL